MRAYSHREGEHSEDETDLCPSARALHFLYFIPCLNCILVIYIVAYILHLKAAGVQDICEFVTSCIKQEMMTWKQNQFQRCGPDQSKIGCNAASVPSVSTKAHCCFCTQSQMTRSHSKEHPLVFKCKISSRKLISFLALECAQIDQTNLCRVSY